MTETENNWIPRHDLICRVRIPVEAYQHIGCYQGQKTKQQIWQEANGQLWIRVYDDLTGNYIGAIKLRNEC